MSGMRDAIVDNALWGVAHEPQIHYRQSRPIDGLDQPHKLPLYTDCSGFITCCYAWAGVVDPNGNTYDGEGYTGTLLFLEHIQPEELQRGDLIVFGPGNGDHVVVAIEDGPDPMTVSHGQEKGPLKIRLSTETRAHRPPMTCLRGAGLDDDTPAPPQEDGFMAALTEAEQKALAVRVEAIQQSADRTDKALKTLLGPDEDGADERVALFDPKDGLYAKVTALDAKVEQILKKLDT